MSLPDTVFIFVLALIIFGPKKLPEIGRQIGKLVGEFRRASNEFKYQIEEEMRQIDIQEKPAKQSIAAPIADADASEAVQPPVLAEFPADPAESLPVGQHPNIDMLDTSELRGPEEPAFYDYESEADEYESTYDMTADGETESESASVGPELATAAPETSAAPIIRPAEGSQPRTTPPFTHIASPDETPVAPAAGAVHTPAETEVSHG